MTATTTTPPDLVVLSLGAGVQSTTLVLLMLAGTLPRIDAAIFADTGWEPPAVYEQVDRLEAALAEAQIPLHRVAEGNLRTDAITPDHRFASIPYFVQGAPGPCERCARTGLVADAAGPVKCGRCRGTGWDDGKGMGRRQCTSEYKLKPIQRRVRELLGAPAPDHRRVPRGRVAEQWVGFSTDEIARAGNTRRVRYERTRYPLLELGMSRRDCTRYLERAGWGHTVKSACVGCPFHGNRQWRDLRDNHPEQWADAVAFDHAIRKGGARGLPLTGEAFLHRSRVPLELAPIDHVTRGDVADMTAELQGDLFDVLEDGDPDGCSPYACRSGAPVTAGEVT